MVYGGLALPLSEVKTKHWFVSLHSIFLFPFLRYSIIEFLGEVSSPTGSI